MSESRLPYLRRDDPELPAFSFVVPGVTSISVDLHKYACTPKGASILLHRNPDLRRSQYFASARWPGYTMINSTMQSTRSGAPLAAAWAVTRFIGHDGYARLARQVRDGVRILINEIEQIDHLRVLFEPDSSLLSIAGDDHLDVFTLSDELHLRGWHAQPQLSFGPFPPTMHLSVSAATTQQLPVFIDALRGSVKSASAAGPVTLDPRVAAAVADLDPADLDETAFADLLQIAGLAGPEGMALRG